MKEFDLDKRIEQDELLKELVTSDRVLREKTLGEEYRGAIKQLLRDFAEHIKPERRLAGRNTDDLTGLEVEWGHDEAIDEMEAKVTELLQAKEGDK